MTKITPELRKAYRDTFGYGLWEDAEKGLVSRDHEVLQFIAEQREEAVREGRRKGKMEVIERARAFIQSEWQDPSEDDDLFPYFKGMEDLLKFLTDPLRKPNSGNKFLPTSLTPEKHGN